MYEDLYENAPCGHLSTRLDGTIIKVNATLLGWLGHSREDVLGRRFADLLTIGGKLYHETHYAPLLHLQGEVGGIALELRAADQSKLPVLVSSVVKDGEIRTAVFDARERRSYEQELLRARQEADQERERVQRLVSTLQQTLLPPSLPTVPGVQGAAYYHPASADQVGGDFYDMFLVRDGQWCFFMGDVSGKGAGAAVVTSLARYTLRAAAVYNSDPLVLLERLNTVLNQQYRDRRFCTVLTGLLTRDADGWIVTLASGGHPPALLVHPDGTASYQHTSGGQLVGPLRDARFVSTTVRLNSGDTLLLYTDGLIEARTRDTRYSEEALLDFVTRIAPNTAQTVVASLTRLLASFGDGLDDDTALLALSF
jgi:sigma-B regulation protein RsbU (phosphoserine phosphatase)